MYKCPTLKPSVSLIYDNLFFLSIFAECVCTMTGGKWLKVDLTILLWAYVLACVCRLLLLLLPFNQLPRCAAVTRRIYSAHRVSQ